MIPQQQPLTVEQAIAALQSEINRVATEVGKVNECLGNGVAVMLAKPYNALKQAIDAERIAAAKAAKDAAEAPAEPSDVPLDIDHA